MLTKTLRNTILKPPSKFAEDGVFFLGRPAQISPQLLWGPRWISGSYSKGHVHYKKVVLIFENPCFLKMLELFFVLKTAFRNFGARVFFFQKLAMPLLRKCVRNRGSSKPFSGGSLPEASVFLPGLRIWVLGFLPCGRPGDFFFRKAKG